MAWCPRQSTQFIEAFQRGDQNASLIMIFYGVGLHLVRHVWYVSDLGAKLVAELVPLFEEDLALAAASNGAGLESQARSELETMDLDGAGANAGDHATGYKRGSVNGSGADHGSNGIGINDEVTSRTREKAALVQWALEQVAS
jgi:hypothetical protein